MVEKPHYKGTKCGTFLKNTMPADLGSFILSKCKEKLKDFIDEVDGFKTTKVFYTDTVCLNTEKIHWDVLVEAPLVGHGLRQRGNDYKKRLSFLWVDSGT